MAITNTDILCKLSIKTGSAGNSSSQSNINQSLGKYISTTEITDASKNNLFDDVTGDENLNSTVDYRCFFVHNNHESLTWLGVVAWISEEVEGGTNIAIGVDATEASEVDSSSAQAVSIASETDAPSDVSFSSPTTKSGGISIGDLPAGSCRAIWVRRSAANTSAVDNDGFTITLEGDTTA